MSKCPDCGAPEGKAHTCKARLKKMRTPSERPKSIEKIVADELAKYEPDPDPEAVALTAIQKIRKPRPSVKKIQAEVDQIEARAIAPSHPDCERCKQIREQTRNRVRKVRAKK